VATLAVVVVAMLPPVAGAAGSAADGRPVGVIVQARPGGLETAARQVQDLGGRVGRQLQVINGLSAVVPRGRSGSWPGRRRSGR
jgi:tripartite-type tricarboxylate transporter receptor subunit TctC